MSPSSATVTLPPPTQECWSLARKVVLRVGCTYALLYVLAHSFVLPLGEYVGMASGYVWDALVPWLGEHVLGVPYDITVKPAGSGDTTYNYVQIFGMAVLALVFGGAWAVVDRRRSNDAALLYVFTVCARYYLAFAMLAYGFAKVFKSQFPFPGLERLVTTYGDSSPMGLLWTFMGYSTPYTVFAGLGEVVAGLLLLFRRTTTLGALVVIGVMSNVAMMNYSYDVPVKLYSTHLLLLGVFLAMRDVRRVLAVFVLNRPAPAADLSSPLRGRRLNYARLGLKVLVVGYVLYADVSSSLESYRRWGDGREKPVLYGLYEVETHVLNGLTIPPLLDDPDRWRRVIVDRAGMAGIQGMDDAVARYTFRPDTLARTVTLFPMGDSTFTSVLSYEEQAPDGLFLTGVFEGDTLDVRLRRRAASDFLLVNRGFHWINEYPFHR